jgi:hypothetical protein
MNLSYEVLANTSILSNPNHNVSKQDQQDQSKIDKMILSCESYRHFADLAHHVFSLNAKA